jgi:hypothetical protein
MRHLHGLTRGGQLPNEYHAWAKMRERCTNPSAKDFKHYGGRGIKVCIEWENFSVFLNDMGRRPAGHTLERRDNGGNYEPSNCYWATWHEQQRNRRNNVRITFQGETLCVSEWATRLGIDHSTIRKRLSKGDPPELALRPVNVIGEST